MKLMGERLQRQKGGVKESQKRRNETEKGGCVLEQWAQKELENMKTTVRIPEEKD